MLKNLKTYLNETTDKYKTEYKTIKRKKGSKLFYWLIIASIVAAFFLYANDIRSSSTKTQDSYQEELQQFKQEQQELLEKLDKRFKNIDKRIEEQNNRIEGVKQAKAKKAEEARLAAIQQPTRPKPVQRVGTNVGGNCETYRPLVAQYGWNVGVAMAVMKAESGCNPNAANWTDNHKVCKGSFGLFQISCHSGQVFDPVKNVQIAYQKYAARHWQPWGVCRGKVVCI